MKLSFSFKNKIKQKKKKKTSGMVNKNRLNKIQEPKWIFDKIRTQLHKHEGQCKFKVNSSECQTNLHKN
jgi:hypothetical protein